MRWTAAGFAILLCIATAPATGGDCGTIDRTGATIETGTAPVRSPPRIDPCAGPGWPATIHPPGFEPVFDERTAVWATRVHPGTCTERHGTSESGTFPGGCYEFRDYHVPAGVTLTYTGPVRIHASERVRIHGVVTSNAPDASIWITGEHGVWLEGADIIPARIETHGDNSSIEIHSRRLIEGKYRSQIRAAHGSVLLSAHGTEEGNSGVDLASTDVRAGRGGVAITAYTDVSILEGSFAADDAILVIQSTLGAVTIEHAILDGSAAQLGIAVEGLDTVAIRGRTDACTNGGTLQMTSREGDLEIDGVYNLSTQSGRQAYRAGKAVRITPDSWIYSEAGDIVIAGSSPLMSADVESASILADSGEIHISGSGSVALSGTSLVHSRSGRVRVLADGTLRLSQRARFGDETSENGPVEILCGDIDDTLAETEAHILGSSVDVVFAGDTAQILKCPIRASDGDLRIRSAGTFRSYSPLTARRDMEIEAGRELSLLATSVRTDDVAEGASGSILIRSWGAGSGDTIHLADSTIRTGDSPVESGGIEILMGTAVTDDPLSAWIVPKTVALSLNAGTPEKSRLAITGLCDLGVGAPGLDSAAELSVGGLTIPVIGLAPNAAGTKFSVKADGLTLLIAPSKKGTSRGKFKLVYRGDLSGKIDAAGDLAIRYAGDGIDAVGTVRLAKGKYRLRKVAGTLVEPGIWVAKAKASFRGSGKDSLTLQLGLATDGTVPAAASDVLLSFGEGLSVTIPAASFTRKGDRYEFRGDADGITRVVVDWAKETVKVTGKNLDLSAIPEGPSSIGIGIAIGTDARTAGVRLVRTGKRLRY